MWGVSWFIICSLFSVCARPSGVRLICAITWRPLRGGAHHGLVELQVFFCARVFWQNQSWLAHSQRRNPSSIIIGYNNDNTANKKKDERTAKKCIFLADNVWVTADRVFFRCIHNKKGSENTGLSACSDIFFFIKAYDDTAHFLHVFIITARWLWIESSSNLNLQSSF